MPHTESRYKIPAGGQEIEYCIKGKGEREKGRNPAIKKRPESEKMRCEE